MPKDKVDAILEDLAALIAGLQVPVSLVGSMPVSHETVFGTAYEPWLRLKQNLTGFGWTDATTVEAALRKELFS